MENVSQSRDQHGSLQLDSGIRPHVWYQIQPLNALLQAGVFTTLLVMGLAVHSEE